MGRKRVRKDAKNFDWLFIRACIELKAQIYSPTHKGQVGSDAIVFVHSTENDPLSCLWVAGTVMELKYALPQRDHGI